MFENLKSTMKDPDFQRAAALAAGKVGATVLSMVASVAIQRFVDKGINLAMDKVQHVVTTTATDVE